MRRRQNRSVGSSRSPVKKSIWDYTPEQEKMLWEAFAVSVYPSVNRQEELAEKLGLTASVVKRFFTSKRSCHFRRLYESGQGDKVLQIQQANNVPLWQCRAWKNKADKLNEVDKRVNHKLERLEKPQKKKGKLKQEGPTGQTEQDGTVGLNIDMPPNLHQGQILLQQQQQNQQQQFPCLGWQPHYYEQHLPPPHPESGQEYQYGLGGQQLAAQWDNRLSMAYSPLPIHLTPGYSGPYHSSTGSSYGFMQCPPNPCISGMNAVWAPTPPAPFMNTTWTSPSSVDLPMFQNIGRTNDFQFTQNMVTTDSSDPPLTQTHRPDFSQNYYPGFNQNQDQNLGIGQYQDNRCWNLSGNSAPCNDMFPPSATANSTHYRSNPATQYPSHTLDPNPFYSGPAHYPTPDPSLSISDLYLSTILTQDPPQSPNQPSDPPQSHNRTTIADQSAKGYSSTKSDFCKGKSSSNSSSSHQHPSPSAEDTNWAHQSFDLGLTPAQTPPRDSIPSAPPLSATPLQDLTHTAPPDHCSYTQPAAYGVRLFVAQGNRFATQEESTPDPDRTFTYYPNISGVEGREEDQVHFVSQILQEVNTIL